MVGKDESGIPGTGCRFCVPEQVRKVEQGGYFFLLPFSVFMPASTQPEIPADMCFTFL